MGETLSEYQSCAVCSVARKDHDSETFVEWDGWRDDGPLSAHETEALRTRYSDPEIPPCRVCGTALKIGKMGGGEPTVWHCGSDDANWLGSGEGWNGPKYHHYQDSEYVQRRHGDRSVIRALDELDALRTTP